MTCSARLPVATGQSRRSRALCLLVDGKPAEAARLALEAAECAEESNAVIEAARAAGYADVVAPPTFAVVIQERTLAQLLAEPDAGIDFSRVVHGDQRFTFSREIVVSCCRRRLPASMPQPFE